MREYASYVLAVVTFFVCFGLFQVWQDWKDTRLALASDRYEACIVATYGMNVPQYMSTHGGQLPECY